MVCESRVGYERDRARRRRSHRRSRAQGSPLLSAVIGGCLRLGVSWQGRFQSKSTVCRVCVALLAVLLPLASCFTTSILPFRSGCPREKSSRVRWSLPKCEGRRGTNGGFRAVKGALSDWAKNAGVITMHSAMSRSPHVKNVEKNKSTSPTFTLTSHHHFFVFLPSLCPHQSLFFLFLALFHSEASHPIPRR